MRTRGPTRLSGWGPIRTSSRQQAGSGTTARAVPSTGCEPHARPPRTANAYGANASASPWPRRPRSRHRSADAEHRRKEEMARYTGTVEAPHGAEQVWHYLADLRSAEEWDPSVEDVELVLGEPRTMSARYDLAVRFGGRSINIPYRVTELDPPHRVVFEAETDSVSVRDEARIVPKGPAACSVTWGADLRL